jgi:hypothetical protein
VTSTNLTTSADPSGADAGAGPAGYAYEWARFADWCAATDRTPLPAHPVTLAEFLDEHPAPAATQRRRVAAITRTHTTHGHPSPARAAAIRALLRPPPPADADAREAERTRRSTVAALVADLPTNGWPHGLFGRRDGLLLVLTQLAQLSPTQVSRLGRCDLHTDPAGQLLITTGPWDTTALPRMSDPRSCPGCIYCRWAWIARMSDRYPSVRTLRDALRRSTPITAGSPHRCTTPIGPDAADTVLAARDERPLLTPIDSWGYQPLHPTALSPKAVSELTTAHLHGTAVPHRTLPPPVHIDDGGAAAAPEPSPTPRPSPAQEAARAAALRARRQHDHERLTEASTALADIDDRIQDLLQRTLALLDSAQEPGRP